MRLPSVVLLYLISPARLTLRLKLLALLSMGLDGGTYITRSDVLRGQSWELAQADNSRSTRGGNASTSAARTRNFVDARTAKCVPYSSLSLIAQTILSLCVSQCRLTVLSACEQEHQMVYVLFVQPAATSSYCS